MRIILWLTNFNTEYKIKEHKIRKQALFRIIFNNYINNN